MGTSISSKAISSSGDEIWVADTDRILYVDETDFPMLGVDVDDLVDAFVKTVLTVVAIDKVCVRLMEPVGNTTQRGFNHGLF